MASWEKTSTSIWPTWSENKLFTTLLGILMVYGIVWMGVHIKISMMQARSVGFSELSAPTISVSATGKATATPNIATVDVTVTKTGTTSAEAQNAASTAMTAVLAAIKTFGIADADLQTSSFTTSETYDYTVSPAKLTGYQSTQVLTVKIRNTDLTSSVIDAGPANGATSVSSLRYEVDDETAVQQEARVDAMAKAKTQAQDIAKAMGVRLGKVVSYNESTGSVYPIYYGLAADAAKTTEATPAPIQTGTQDVELTVSVVYSIF